MNAPAKWHFSRAALADAYLKQLEAGLNSIAIFAERRKGKTEFLLEDLEPAAKERGLRTVYINFWARKSDPVYCIAQGVRRALDTSSSRLLRRWKKEFSVTLGAIQAKASIDPIKSPEFAMDALEMLIDGDGAVLIMFDEIQHLATSSEFEELIASLRTFLDSNRKRARAVFTGSSQDRLNQIFRRQNAAFYRGASLVDFPDMEEDFLVFLLQNFKELTGRNLPLEGMVDVFSEYNHSPFMAVDLLQTMMREGIYDFDRGLAFYLVNNNPFEEWSDLWGSLKMIDRVVLSEVIAKSRPLYQTETYKLISNILGVEKVGRGVIQASINRLRGLGILNNEGRGQWAFESSEFKSYVDLHQV